MFGFFFFKESNDGETTILAEPINASDSPISLSSTINQTAADRTLCESQAFNANSISTPFSSNLQKQILTPNLSCIEITPNCVS